MSTNASAETAPSSERRSGGLKALLVPLVIALALGGGAFFALQNGYVVIPALTAEMKTAEEAEIAASGPPDLPSFVALAPFVISLSPESASRHLKVALQVETIPGREADVEAHAPRIADILNGYLRAVDEREFENPRALARLRAQMLRRVQMVTPEGSVRDLLVQEFVLN